MNIHSSIPSLDLIQQQIQRLALRQPSYGPCVAIAQSKRLSLYGDKLPDGKRLGWSCSVPYCGNPDHFLLCENIDNLKLTLSKREGVLENTIQNQTKIETSSSEDSICYFGTSITASIKKRNRTWRDRHGEKPKGYKVGTSCCQDCCINPDHMELKKWDSFKSNGRWSNIRDKLLSMKMDETFDLPDFPSDEQSRALLYHNMHSHLLSSMVKFAIRSMRTGGIQIIRLGEWGTSLTPENITSKVYPVMCWNGWKRSRDWSLEAGAAFLGLLWGTWDLPKEQRTNRVALCSEKACPFPCMDGATVCRQHWEWDSAKRSYSRAQKLDYATEAFSRASDDLNVHGLHDAVFHSGWIHEDKSNFLNTTTLTKDGTFVKKPKYERENDKWWKENVTDKGIEVPGVGILKTSKELKAEMDEMIEESLARYTEFSLEESMENIQKFFRVSKEENPLHYETPKILPNKIRNGAVEEIIRKESEKHSRKIAAKRLREYSRDEEYFEDIDLVEDMPDTLILEEM